MVGLIYGFWLHVLLPISKCNIWPLTSRLRDQVPVKSVAARRPNPLGMAKLSLSGLLHSSIDLKVVGYVCLRDIGLEIVMSEFPRPRSLYPVYSFH